MCKIYFYTFIYGYILCLVQGYKIFSMRELGRCVNTSEIHLDSATWNSSGILVQAVDNTFVPGLHCIVSLIPPFSYGIVISIRYINFQPATLKYADCQNYLEISPVEHHGSVRFCGYSFDQYEFQSYFNWRRRTNIIFHTSNESSENSPQAAFQLTFTAIKKEIDWCHMQETRCRNGHCIWNGLACDGHNNCGDMSDEFDKFIAQCGKMSAGESLGVILITIVGSLTLLVIAAYLRGPKIARQIARLSENRRSECPQIDPTGLSEEDTEESSSISTISRLRAGYESRRELLSSYSYSADVPDPPPPYEAVQSQPVVDIPCVVTTDNSINNSNPS